MLALKNSSGGVVEYTKMVNHHPACLGAKNISAFCRKFIPFYELPISLVSISTQLHLLKVMKTRDTSFQVAEGVTQRGFELVQVSFVEKECPGKIIPAKPHGVADFIFCPLFPKKLFNALPY